MKLLFKLLLTLIILVGGAVLGAYYFFQKSDIPYADLETRYANPASKFADLPSGVRMHYRDQGNPQGRPLLLIHGFGVSLETWEPWVKLLSKDYRLISLDLPGHGLTRTLEGYRPTITSFADVSVELASMLGLEKFTVIGNSMGGQTAWNVALRHPAKLDALVLIDAGGWFEPARLEEAPMVFRILNNPQVSPYLAKLDPRPFMKNGLEAAFADKSLVTNRILDRYTDMAMAPGHRPMLGAIMREMTPEVFASKEKLAAISVPTLIMWGDKDELIPVGDAQKFKEAIAGSTVIIYPNIGHLPYEEAAQQSAADLRKFLQGQHEPATQ